MESRIASFVERHWAVPRERLTLGIQPFRGGLESTVVRVTIRAEPSAGLPRHLIVKALTGPQRREAVIYRSLWSGADRPPAARLLGSERVGDIEYLYLEHLPRPSAWPWSRPGAAAAVCRELARLHDTAMPLHPAGHWDYEAELGASAVETLEVAAAARGPDGVRWWRRLGDLRRVVDALPRLRARLLALGTVTIHGDVHPGNVVARRGRRGTRIALIDWGRTRIGSPLEDIASWLHSLGCWDAEARRRHDTLLGVYLRHRAGAPAVTGDLRTAYGIASAGNGLAGAIRYHLAVLGDPAARARARRDSRTALEAWQRTIRGTASLLTATGVR